MRTVNALVALLGSLPLVLGGCRADTQHTGRRPLAPRRPRDPGPEKTLEQRLAEREERLGDVSEREGEAVRSELQVVGVGATHRYHEPGCALLRDVPRADRVLFVSVYDALDGGYGPCTTCNPGP